MLPFIQSIIFTLLALAFSFFFADHAAAEQSSDRFFLMGSGTMQLKNLRNNREAKVSLLKRDGSLNEEARKKVDWVFGFPTEEKGEHISLRLLFMLSYFTDRLAPGKAVNIESAYRSPEYNDQIRAQGNNAARTSTHQDGIALDFWLEGVDGKRIWETIRAKNCGGIGHYGGKTVHFDAGRPRFWEAATSGTRAKEPDYNRHLYLSTDFDRYRPQEQVRLAFSGISNFDFGVRPTVQVFRTDDPQNPVAGIRLNPATAAGCFRIGNRKTSRFLTTSLPANLPAGRYNIKVDFCDKPFTQMPSDAVSNAIELKP